MADTTTTPPESASVLDQVANFLTEEQPKTPAPKKLDDIEADDTQPEESNQEVEPEVEPEVESEEPEETEDDTTWDKVLGVDPSQLVLDEEGNFAGVKVKVDGETSDVALKDLIYGYQNNKSNTNKSQQIAEQRKELEQTINVVAQEYTKKLETADKLTQHLKDTLLNDYKNVDWNRLRVENPGEYAAAIQDFNIRTNEIEQISTAIDEEKQTLTQKQIEDQQIAFKNYIAEQAKLVLVNNPEWSKPEVFKKALSDMTTFAESTYGFTPQEFANIQDARVLEVVKDAMKFRQGLTVAKTKLETKVPTFQKSTGKKTQTVTKLQKLTQKAKSTTGYQKRNAETDAVAELLLNS